MFTSPNKLFLQKSLGTLGLDQISGVASLTKPVLVILHQCWMTTDRMYAYLEQSDGSSMVEPKNDFVNVSTITEIINNNIIYIMCPH